MKKILLVVIMVILLNIFTPLQKCQAAYEKVSLSQVITTETYSLCEYIRKNNNTLVTTASWVELIRINSVQTIIDERYTMTQLFLYPMLSVDSNSPRTIYVRVTTQDGTELYNSSSTVTPYTYGGYHVFKLQIPVNNISVPYDKKISVYIKQGATPQGNYETCGVCWYGAGTNPQMSISMEEESINDINKRIGDAVTAAQAAQTAAQAVQSSASSAASDASSAVTAANNAKTAADSAKIAADSAKSAVNAMQADITSIKNSIASLTTKVNGLPTSTPTIDTNAIANAVVGKQAIIDIKTDAAAAKNMLNGTGNGNKSLAATYDVVNEARNALRKKAIKVISGVSFTEVVYDELNNATNNGVTATPSVAGLGYTVLTGALSGEGIQMATFTSKTDGQSRGILFNVIPAPTLQTTASVKFE